MPGWLQRWGPLLVALSHMLQRCVQLIELETGKDSTLMYMYMT